MFSLRWYGLHRIFRPWMCTSCWIVLFSWPSAALSHRKSLLRRRLIHLRKISGYPLLIRSYCWRMNYCIGAVYIIQIFSTLRIILGDFLLLNPIELWNPHIESNYDYSEQTSFFMSCVMGSFYRMIQMKDRCTSGHSGSVLKLS